MDVPPPWYTPTAETCAGEVRRCGGGDAACRADAEREGYVAISNYTFCRRDEVRTVPTLNAVLMGVFLAGLVGAWGFSWWRRRRRG